MTTLVDTHVVQQLGYGFLNMFLSEWSTKKKVLLSTTDFSCR